MTKNNEEKGPNTEISISIPMEVSEWDIKKIQRLVDYVIEENETLEYIQKAWNLDAKEKPDIERKICSFANTSGGIILFGIKEKRSKDKQLLEGLEIVGVEDRPNCDIQIGNYYKNATPIPKCKLNKIDLGNGRFVIVLSVEKSFDRPVQSSEGKYYIRIQSESKTMNRDTIKNLFLESDIWVQRRNHLLLEIEELIDACKIIEDRGSTYSGHPSFEYFNSQGLKTAFIMNYDLSKNKVAMELYKRVISSLREIGSMEKEYKTWVQLGDIRANAAFKDYNYQIWSKARDLKENLTKFLDEIKGSTER